MRDESGLPPPEEPIDFSLLFTNASPEAVHLLQNLLSLDPTKRLTANQSLEHPFVAAFRDPNEEINCNVLFDFDSFEMIESEYVLRKCIVDEVMQMNGIHGYLASSSFSSEGSRRRYTGSSISTPASAFTAEANQHAIDLAQAGMDVPVNHTQENSLQSMVMDGQFVGEPEDMDEDDMRMMDSDESDIHVGQRRTLIGPIDVDVLDLERHLSREW